jgi:hypothetical protein
MAERYVSFPKESCPFILRSCKLREPVALAQHGILAALSAAA